MPALCEPGNKAFSSLHPFLPLLALTLSVTVTSLIARLWVPRASLGRAVPWGRAMGPDMPIYGVKSHLLPSALGVVWTWGCSFIRDPPIPTVSWDQEGVLGWELSGTGVFPVKVAS